jgi:phospholipid/cholesterol/gamma-HCH transport system permease protein
MRSPIAQMNSTFKSYVASVQEFFLLSSQAAANLVRPPFYLRDVFIQMDTIGVGSLTIIVLTGLFTGMVLALQSAYELETFGAKMYVGRLVAVTMVRELGPVLSALMLAGRIGSGIAAELGSMEVSEQISALRAMGTDPIRKLVTPRMLAGIFSAPVLTIIADTFGLLGGVLISFGFLGQTTTFSRTSSRAWESQSSSDSLLPWSVAISACLPRVERRV